MFSSVADLSLHWNICLLPNYSRITYLVILCVLLAINNELYQLPWMSQN